MRYGRIILLFCVGLLLVGGCASSDTRPVAVMQPIAFAHMSQRMGDELIARNLLDAHKYYTSMPAPDVRYGDILFTRLAPNFLFTDRGLELKSTSFAGAVMPGTQVTRTEKGFTMRSFRQRITVTMIAVTDWDNDGKPDWLLSCTADPGNGGRTREYYVVVPAPQGRERLQGRVIGVNECFGLSCHFYLNEEECVRTQPPAQNMATEATDVLPGLHKVTVPPDASARNDSAVLERDLQ